MSKTLVLLLVVSLAVNLAAVVTFSYYWWSEEDSARDPERVRQVRDPEVRPELLRRRLNLSEEQIEEVSRQREAMMRGMMSLRRESSEMRRDLMSLLEAEEVDRRKADSLLSEIASLQVNIERQVFEHLMEMKDVLTQEQQKHLLRMLERRLHPGEAGHPLLEEHFEERAKEHPRQGGKRGGDYGEWQNHRQSNQNR
jgi:Spy/CpxP family protein refolding chaperone